MWGTSRVQFYFPYICSLLDMSSGDMTLPLTVMMMIYSPTCLWIQTPYLKYQFMWIVRKWMFYNFPHLNTDKPEILVIGPQQNTAHVKQALGLWCIRVSQCLGILGVIIESRLNFEPHKKKNGTVWLLSVEKCWKVSASLLSEHIKWIIRAFITSHLD